MSFSQGGIMDLPKFLSCLATVSLTLAPMAADAQEWPLDGTYGSEGACIYYRVGGPAAVYMGDMAFDDPPEIPRGDVGVLVEPNEIVMMEMACEFAGAEGAVAEFSCRDVG